MWAFWTIDNRHFEAMLDGEKITITAHCLACAKTEILSKHGGKVDTRGHNNVCGKYLKVMQHIINKEACTAIAGRVARNIVDKTLEKIKEK